MATEVVVMLFIAYTPGGHALFGTASVDARAWLFVLPFAAAMLAAEELRKWIVRVGVINDRRRGPNPS